MPAAQPEPRFLVSQYQFDDMHLHVGDRFQLETPGPGGALHYGALIGFSPDQSVLVKTPFVDGLPLPYTDGQALIVRAFTGKGIFAFDTAVQRVCVAPFHYLHLDFPQSVRGAQIRTTERVKVYMPTQLKIDGREPAPGVITDLGIGGAAIECNQHLKAKDNLTVQLRFALADMHLTAGFEAHAVVHKQIESTKTDQASALYGYGIEFVDITLGQTVMLQNFVYHQLLADHQVLI
jgi:c-di-GMP-binding flagellar brake protein YcgR